MEQLFWGLEKTKYNLTKAETGDFVVKDPVGNVSYMKERWLMSYHRVLSLYDIGNLKHSFNKY